MLETAISLITSLYLLVVGLVVVVKNPKNSVNVSLGVALSFLAFWVTAVAGLTTPLGENPLYGRVVFTMAVLGIHGLYLFSYFITATLESGIKRRFTPVVSSVVAGVIALLTLSPWILERAEISSAGTLPTPVYGPLYPLFVVWIVFEFVAIATLLIKYFRHSRGVKRYQAQTILLGISLAVAVGLVTNVMLPIIFNNSETAKLAPLSMIILSTSLSYAVLRHRFLDIGLVVARATGYLLALGVLIIVYSLISYVIAGTIFTQLTNTAEQLLNIGLLIFMALTFTPVKRFFDRITNKIFYHDAYNPQEFFNRFNEALVANAELEQLLKAATSLVATNLNAEFCHVVLGGKDIYHPRILGTTPLSFSHQDISQGRHLLAHLENKIIVTDYLEEADPLKQLLLKNRIGVLARLSDGQNLGFLLIGQKRSGNLYNTQDLRVIEALTDGLVIAIQNSLRFEQIERFNETLQAKIESATRKLRRTNEKLRLLDQTKDDFISMASHQLRTPLTSVKGYVSMVLDGDAGHVTGMQRRLLNQSYVSAQRMVYLISDLLNVSRLRTGKFVIEPTPSNLAMIIRSEIDQLIETAESRNLKLTYHRPEHFPTLMLDETKMRQVIMNFIDNAIYYTPSGGRIEVTLVEKPQTVEFTVIDTGIGVPKQEQHRLFTKFYRAGNAKRARPDGTGLGLFMAKKVIIAQGGAIIFKSQEGKGSIFGFSFAKNKLLPSNQPVVTEVVHK